MTLPAHRDGERLLIKKRPVEFSFWPTRAGARGNNSLNPKLFSQDPWAMIEIAVKRNCVEPAKSEALAYMHQARDYHEACTESGKISSRPLNLYYSLMNMFKSLALCRGLQPTFERAQHGLSEQLVSGGMELVDAYLDAYPSPGSHGRLQNFSEYLRLLTGQGLQAQQRFNLTSLLPQILPGHRLWAEAREEKERFVAFHLIRPMYSKNPPAIWLNLFVVKDDLSRLGVSAERFLAESSLNQNFRVVQCDEQTADGRALFCFEQLNPIPAPTRKYANYVNKLVDAVKTRLWATVGASPPYRRYYGYMCPQAELQERLPQLASIFAVAYYLGSITRYRPHHFTRILESPYGPRVLDFISGQPQQHLYLCASEFYKQEISRPSIV